MPLCKLSRREAKLKKKPWITKGLLKSIKTRNKMFITLCKQNFADKTLHLKYKKYRNLLTRLQDKAKINYYRHSFNVNKNDSTNTWKLINEIINQKNTSKFPSNIRHYNTSISCQKSICDILTLFRLGVLEILYDWGGVECARAVCLFISQQFLAIELSFKFV